MEDKESKKTSSKPGEAAPEVDTKQAEDIASQDDAPSVAEPKVSAWQRICGLMGRTTSSTGMSLSLASSLWKRGLSMLPPFSGGRLRKVIWAIVILLIIGVVWWSVGGKKTYKNTAASNQTVKLKKSLQDAQDDRGKYKRKLIQEIVHRVEAENKAKKALEALKQAKIQQAKVMKDSKVFRLTEGGAYTRVLSLLQAGAYKRLTQYVNNLAENEATLYEPVMQSAVLYATQAKLNSLTILLLKNLMAHYPNKLKYRLVMARVDVAQNMTTAAIASQTEELPVLRLHSNYYAVLAAAYLKAGRFFEAQGVYRQLTQAYPTDARFWLGLAITEQRLRLYSQAHRSYANALGSAEPGWPAIGFIAKQQDKFSI